MKCIVIGSSTGGPSALEEVITNLPSDLRAIVIIAQHIGASSARSMAERLNEMGGMPVSILEEGDDLKESHVYVVPGKTHFFVIGPDLVARLLPSDKRPSPSIDMAFTSVAEHFGPDTIGVVLTGMGEDGTIGAKAIQQLGGTVIAQDEDSSVIYGMPKSVAEAGLIDDTLPLERIAAKLVYLTK